MLNVRGAEGDTVDAVYEVGELIAEFDNCEGTVNTAFHQLKRRLDSFCYF
jgi:hypothetical protein